MTSMQPGWPPSPVGLGEDRQPPPAHRGRAPTEGREPPCASARQTLGRGGPRTVPGTCVLARTALCRTALRRSRTPTPLYPSLKTVLTRESPTEFPARAACEAIEERRLM